MRSAREIQRHPILSLMSSSYLDSGSAFNQQCNSCESIDHVRLILLLRHTIHLLLAKIQLPVTKQWTIFNYIINSDHGQQFTPEMVSTRWPNVQRSFQAYPQLIIQTITCIIVDGFLRSPSFSSSLSSPSSSSSSSSSRHS